MRQIPIVARAALTVACSTLALTALAPAPVRAQGNDVPSDFEIAPDDDGKPADKPAGSEAPPTRGAKTNKAPAAPAAGEGASDQDGTRRKIEGETGGDDRRPDPAAEAGGNGPLGESQGLNIHAHREGQPTLFGTYRIRVSYDWPKFDNGLKFYDKLYGKPSQYPQLGADWFAWDWYATLGIGFRIGYYTADGHAAACAGGSSASGANGCQNPKSLPESQITIDQTQKTSLTLLPVQVVASAEFTPFDRKWVVLDGWVGLERAYYQETRQPPTSSTPSTSTPAPTTSTPTGTTQQDTTLTNTGWTSATTIGVSANILLNGLDPSAAASMRGPMGLGYIYLSPSLEIVRTITKSGVSFGRTVYALGFTFESVN